MPSPCDLREADDLMFAMAETDTGGDVAQVLSTQS